MIASTRSKTLSKHWSRAVALSSCAAILLACGSDADPPPVNTTNGGSGGSSGADVDSGGVSGGAAGSGSGATTSAGGTGSGGSMTTGGAAGSDDSGGGGGTGGSSSGGAGGSGGSDGGTGGSGGSGGSTDVDAGVPPDGGTTDPPRCKPSTVWAPLRRVDSISNEHLGVLSSVSPDELTVAWTSGSGDVYVADRLAVRDPFGAPNKVNVDALASDRAALSPTGTSLIAIRADRGAFVGFERVGRDAAWGSSTGLEFTQVRGVYEGGALGSAPVLSGDKHSFFFVMTRTGQPPVLYESVWDGPQRSWGRPVNVSNAELAGAANGKRRRPTGTSSDGLTLFFFDETTNLERAAWRNAVNAPFNLFKDIGAFPEAVPSFRCDTLYYQGQDSLGVGVFMGE